MTTTTTTKRATKSQLAKDAIQAPYKAEQARQDVGDGTISLSELATAPKVPKATVKPLAQAIAEMKLTGETPMAYDLRQSRQASQKSTQADKNMQAIARHAIVAPGGEDSAFLESIGIAASDSIKPVKAVKKTKEAVSEGPKLLVYGKPGARVDLEALMDGKAPRVHQAVKGTQKQGEAQSATREASEALKAKPSVKAKQPDGLPIEPKAETRKYWIEEVKDDEEVSDRIMVNINGDIHELTEGQSWMRGDKADNRWVGYIKGKHVYFWDINHQGFIPDTLDIRFWNRESISEFHKWAIEKNATIAAFRTPPATPAEWKAYKTAMEKLAFDRRQTAMEKATERHAIEETTGTEPAPVKATRKRK